MHITYTSDSLSFWPKYHQQSTNISPTTKSQHIGQVSAAISTKISADSRLMCRPSLGRYLGWYIGSIRQPKYLGRDIGQESVNMSTDILVDTRPICWPIHWSSVSLYVDRYIGQGVHKIGSIDRYVSRYQSSGNQWSTDISTIYGPSRSTHR